MKTLKVLCLLFFVGFSLAFFLMPAHTVQRVAANFSGPPAGHTGAPGESTCLACHISDQRGPDGQEPFRIVGPQTYSPGQTYQITVQHLTQDPSRLLPAVEYERRRRRRR